MIDAEPMNIETFDAHRLGLEICGIDRRRGEFGPMGVRHAGLSQFGLDLVDGKRRRMNRRHDIAVLGRREQHADVIVMRMADENGIDRLSKSSISICRLDPYKI